MTFEIPATTDRVALHTSSKVNDEIRERTARRIAACAAAGDAAIDERLRELDREWDIERSLETNGSVLLLAGLALGVFVDRKWLALPALVGTFCLQHALQGWCPPIEAFRRLGVRTAREIEEERVALKALRGDFRDVPGEGGSERRADAAYAAASC